MIASLQNAHNIIGSKTHRYKPEQGKSDLTETTAQLPPICHPFVFQKMEPKPRHSLDGNQFLLHVKMSLYIDLQRLINKKNQKSYEQYVFELHSPQFVQI
jgi:hypothetical protein